MANAEWLNRYVSIEKETTFGSEPSGTQTFGEVDDESFKQTFDLLVRSDMSRQVASKAVTNTKYGEGSVNFAVQPDDFMGYILSAFLPVTEEGGFYDSITGTGGFGYAAGSGTMVKVSTIGYWEVRNGQQDALAVAYTANNGVMALDNTTTSTWNTHAGLAVDSDNPGYGILGTPSGEDGTSGFYFKYTGTSGSTLTGVTEFDEHAMTTAIGNGTCAVDTPVVQYENHANGIEPGRVYAYVTAPGAAVSAGAATATGIAAYAPGGGSTITGATSNGTAVGTLTANIGGASKHVFNEPVAAADVYPSFTIRVGREDKEHTFTGMAASRLSFSANLNEYVMASVDFIGQSEETPADIQAGVSFSGNEVDALHFAGAELYVDGSLNTSTKIQSISLEMNINRDIDSAYAIGSTTIERIPPSRTREITGTMEFNEIVYSDTTGLKGEPTYADLATAASVHTIHGGAGRPALKLKFQDADDADHMEIDLYNVRFEAPTASVSGRDPARMSAGFQAFYDSKAKGAAKAIQIKLKGTQLKASAY